MNRHRCEHIGIIPDGNRRWAKAHGMEKKDGYTFGLLPGVQLLRQAKKLGIKEITYYGFTVDNCKRPSEQVRAFTDACVQAVELLGREGADLLVVGNDASDCFPGALRPYTRRTRFGSGGILVNFLVNYGWQWDLSHIRWGGMRRLSGLLPIQSVYADFYVEEKLWPDFAETDLLRALEWYGRQDVTLGG